MGTVAAISRYPVKSMLGETLLSVAVTHRGLSGDRTHAVLDDAGAVGSTKHPRKWQQLLDCRSRLTDDGTVQVELPDGTALPAGDPELDALLSSPLRRGPARAQPGPTGRRGRTSSG
ncbi:MOSC N-terminal beta barrel domain-containing protein [Streptomyces sp. NPDC020801]|uniref:MOSC N-terminal beta barrel domain-containing protein n=1 Tax=Streptomyces sp. NPDC020801 TaxID=3365093 RepID=UPI0037AA3B4F